MLTERAEMTIKAGQEEAFAAVMADEALPILRTQSGVVRVSFGRGVENPRKFILLVEWADMDDHTRFIRSPGFGDFRALMTPFSEGGAMEHFEIG